VLAGLKKRVKYMVMDARNDVGERSTFPEAVQIAQDHWSAQ
jgi:hypothetical protein